jgi:cobalt/nickel transport system permease protein
MHISDGVVSLPLWSGGYVASTLITARIIKGIEPKKIPQIGIMGSVFFVGSLIHIPLGPTSIHLILNGLVGIILGRIAFVAIFLGISLQALLFQHGGITTIGINTLIMGLPSILAFRIFRLHKKFHFKLKEAVFAGIAALEAVFVAAVILAVFLGISGKEFIGIAKIAILANLPVMVIEATVTSLVVSFLSKVKPEILI